MDAELKEIRNFLAQHAPFDDLPGPTLNALPRECTIRYFPRGTVIMPAGEPGVGLHVVRSGAVDMTDEAGSLIERLGAGRAYGITTMLEHVPMRHTCTAIEDTLVIVIDPDAFTRLAKEHPSVEAYYTATYHDRLATAIARLQEASSGTTILGTSIGEIVSREAVTVQTTKTIREAAQIMATERVSSLPVLDGDRLVGILTDRDLRNRVVAAGLDTGLPVTEVMTHDPTTLPHDSMAFEALLAMSSNNVNHLPLVDTAGRTTGMVSTSDLIRLARTNPVHLAADITRQHDLAGVVAQAARIPHALAQLVDEDVSAADLGRIMTALGDAVRRRVITLVQGEMPPAPTAHAWLALGSVAREEEALGSDQDHALVVAEEGHDEWFAEFAERVTATLEECGWPRCPGDMMATNPAWRLTPQQWRQRFIEWSHEPTADAVLDISTVLDMRHLAGDLDLAAQAVAARASSPVLVGHLSVQALRMKPPLGFFRNFVLDQSGEHRDTLDIKRGISAVVQVARVHALRAGTTAMGTVPRIQAAAAAGILGRTSADDLLAALELMGHLRARHQVAQVRAGERPDNHLAPALLSERERRHLRDAFGIVRGAQQQLVDKIGPGYA